MRRRVRGGPECAIALRTGYRELVNAVVVVDARGLRCPVNWAKARTVLEEVTRGTLVEVLVDDPRSERDLPAAAEAEGHAVLEIEPVGSWLRILIEK